MAPRIYIIAGLVAATCLAAAIAYVLSDAGGRSSRKGDDGPGASHAAAGPSAAGSLPPAPSGRRRAGPEGLPPSGEALRERDVARAARTRPGTEAEKTAPGAPEDGLPPGASVLVVAAADDRGEVLPSVMVTLEAKPRGGGATQPTDGAGEATFAGIAAGTYLLRVAAPGRPALHSARSFAIAAGERRRIELRLGDFDLSIGGRVIDGSGQPLAGLEVEVAPYLAATGDAVLVRRNGPFRVRTGDDGVYEVSGLDEGEYEVRTVATDLYASAHRVARAGLRSVDFVLEAVQRVRVWGTVMDAASRPLPDAVVRPLVHGGMQVRTGPGGGYETLVPLSGSQAAFTVTFSLEGYREHREALEAAQLDGLEELRLDAVLEPLRGGAAIRGLLIGEDGAVLSGETVHVQLPAPGGYRQVSSDAGGTFAVEGLEPGKGFRVWVYPKAPYRDAVRDGLEVPAGGLDLELVFEPLGTGTVSGRLIDPDGAPIPHFTLWVASADARNRQVVVEADAEGRFAAEGVPAGELIFQTRSLPRFTVRGVSLEAGGSVDAELTLDWGSYSIASRVVDARGAPVSLARVDLYWNAAVRGARASSYRSAITDREGRFVFTELGRGSHSVRVTKEDYQSVRVEVETGRDAPFPEIVLEPWRRP